jgi:hypothetical protein
MFGLERQSAHTLCIASEQIQSSTKVTFPVKGLQQMSFKSLFTLTATNLKVLKSYKIPTENILLGHAFDVYIVE